jgi:hypothetical protein
LACASIGTEPASAAAHARIAIQRIDFSNL